MNETQRLVRRLDAYLQGRAVLTRATRDLAPDTDITLGIATIKIVTEEHIQAMAFGDPNGAPRIVARIDPLGRDASDLEPFALWLADLFDVAARSNVLPRVWLPHPQTLETLDVLGHRYERNPNASDILRRMGVICRIIAREHRYAAQQMVAVASTLLMGHIATGQSPSEDGHLGALLAWVNPPATGTARDLARARAIEPASGILANHPARPDDERIEKLRREWKRSDGSRQAHAAAQIGGILSRAALDEWALLCEAREAFWALPLNDGALDDCVSHSKQRVLYRVQNGNLVPRNHVPRTRELLALEHSQESLESARLLGDVVVRADARGKGRTLAGTTIGVAQTRPGRNPCILTVATTQRDLRLRPDEKLRAVEANLAARVVSIDFDAHTGGSIVRLELTKGVRAAPEMLIVGMEIEWIRDDAMPLELKTKVLKGLVEPWMFSANPGSQAPSPARDLGEDLLAIAETHLRVRP